VGIGRCKLHFGNNPITHGRYSTVLHVRLRQLIEKHQDDPDPLNIFPELAAARALFEDYINRYQHWAAAVTAWHESYQASDVTGKCAAVRAALQARDVAALPSALEQLEAALMHPGGAGKPRQMLDIADAYRILSEVTKIAKRIEDVRAQNAISRADFIRVMQEMARVVETVVEQHVVEAADREQIKAEIKDRWLEIRLA
jgi:hypothetical protein